jgi:hypothetical protein
MPRTVHIPAYYIDYYAGITLLKDLESLANQYTSDGQSASLLRIQLVPSEKPKLDHWQFALVIVGIMLITSIMAISMYLNKKQAHVLTLLDIYSCIAMSYVEARSFTATARGK